MPKKVSVILCTRNRAHELPACFDSIALAARNAPMVTVEIVIVDNGSSDETPNVTKEWTSKSALASIYVREDRPGLAIARNAGMRAASGDILLCTDDDCRLAPDYFVALDAAYGAVTGPAVIGGRVELGDARDLPLTIKTQSEPAIFEGVGAGGFLLGCNFSLNRAAFALLGPMDERLGAGSPLKSAEETDYVFRAWLKHIPVRYAPELVIYHFHGRRAFGDIRKLMHGYSIGNGALYAKHFGTAFASQLRWDIKNAVLEAFHKASFKPELGLSYRDMVWGNFVGMARYWWGALFPAR
jgi:glycosyltransferase involved in cell wall biosynthesis